jgi:hypothetical protein
LTKAWGSTKVVSRGIAYQADSLPGFIAEFNGKKMGLLTYHIQNESLEIVTLNVLTPGKGIGRSLVERVRNVAVSKNCTRIWVITTNDNKPAMMFYEAVGFKFVKIHRRAIEESRKLKPEIPPLGVDNIPITDEVEFEVILKNP